MDPYAVPLASPQRSSPSAPPTRVRWHIVALLMAFAALCHFNRISISVAGNERIMQQYSISETQMGMVYSSYLFIYTLCMLPGGWLIDRWGPKRALLLLGIGSAVLVPLTGASSLFASANVLLALCVVRGFLGAISAPMHPAAARAVSFWMPYGARGAANGLVTGAAVAGIASTYFVFGALMDAVGWPAAFAISGAVTLLLALVWAAYAADHPAQHSHANTAEQQLATARPAYDSRESGSEPANVAPPGSPAPTALTDQPGDYYQNLSLFAKPSLIILTISYAAYSYFQYLFFYWMQYYFDKVLNLGKDDGRLYATLPLIAMAVGMIVGGPLADYFETRWGARRGRALVPMIGMLASSVLLVAGILEGQPVWAVVTCFSLAMGTLGASEAPFWVTGVQLGGRRGGLSGAFLNTIGNAGGILAPIVTPLFSNYFGWQAGLGLASGVCLIGAVLWLWIDPEA